LNAVPSSGNDDTPGSVRRGGGGAGALFEIPRWSAAHQGMLHHMCNGSTVAVWGGSMQACWT